MAAIDIDWKPDSGKLKVFSIGWLVLFIILGVVTGFKRYDKFTAEQPWTWCWVLWGIGLLVFVIGLVKPAGVRPFYLVLTALTFPIGWTISHLVLGLVYFGLFTPFALVFRLMKRDELHRAIEPGAETYWRKRPPAPAAKRYFQQF